MFIKTIALGNNQEAYIETRLNCGFNIIYSKDNNRGKTILIQSLMYALGNEPAFPVSFSFEDYDHIVELEYDNNTYIICRNKIGLYLSINKESPMFFKHIKDLKSFIHKNIIQLPIILKESKHSKETKIVDPSLLLDIIFVGQDKKDTSKPNGSPYYNKKDCLNMLASLIGQEPPPYDVTHYNSLKKLLQSAIKNKKFIIEKTKLLDEYSPSLSLLNPTLKEIEWEKKLDTIRSIKNTLYTLNTKKQELIYEKAFWENTKEELTVITKKSITGRLVCAECSSTSIQYKIIENSRILRFIDISTKDLQKSFATKISTHIDELQSQINRIDSEINLQQQLFNTELSIENESIFYLLALKRSLNQIESEINSLEQCQNEIHHYQQEIKKFDDFFSNTKEAAKRINKQVAQRMNRIYSQIDPDGNNKFNDIFTTNNKTYSGSEKIIYYLSKLYALQEILNHNFPIIVDSFRAEDLSSEKEELVLNLFKKLNNQIIFTTTLKDEEADKYNDYPYINAIDFTSNKASKLLQSQYVNDFLKLKSIFHMITL